MRLLLATAAIPAFLLTGALACDFNHEAKTQATVTVADGNGCAGSGCMVSGPQDPTAPRSSVDTRVPQTPADGCSGSNCANTQPRLQIADPNGGGGGGGSGNKFDQPPASQMAVAAPGTKSVFGLMTADCTSGNCK